MSRSFNREKSGLKVLNLQYKDSNGDPQDILVFSGAATNTTTVAAEFGANEPPVGSLYLSRAGAQFQHTSAGTTAAKWSLIGTIAGLTATADQINAVASIPVKNATAGTFAINSLVYVSGHDGTTPVISLADANVHKATHIITAAILAGASGTAYPIALVGTLNTNAATAGDPVYLSETAGRWALAAPTAAGSVVQIIGYVAVKSATVGVIHFTPGLIESSKILALTDIPDVTASAAEVNELDGRETVFALKMNATVAEINTGKAILPAAAGITYRLVGFILHVVGAISGGAGTGILLQDTNGTPVVAATIAKAALTSAGIVLPSTPTHCVLGAGFGKALTADKGLSIVKNGATALDAGTSIDVTVMYSLV